MAENNAFSYPPFDQSVVEQISLRQIYLGNNPDVNNNPRTQQWKFNNSSWMRLASSINLDISANKEGIATGNAVKLINNILPNSNTLTYSSKTISKIIY